MTDVFRCGFCGEVGHTISLKKTTHQTFIPHSNCSKRVKFSLKAAESAKKPNPCTNRPVECQVCEEVYWSYAMQKHYETSHPGQECPVKVSEQEKQWVLAK